MDEQNPDGSSAQENQAIRSLKGDPRAPDVVDVGPSFAIAGANEGLYAKYFPTNFKNVPRSMKDGRGFWVGDYWGVVSFGVNSAIVSNVPKSWADLLKPEYRNKVALNGSPLSSGSAVAGVFSAAIANGGSLNDIGPGIDFFQKLKQAGNFIPVQATPQTIASGQTPITIDWDYLNLAYIKEFPSAKIKVSIPSDGVYGAYYCQAVSATAPHPFAARLWEEFLYSDQGQLLWLKGYSHPALFQDLAKRKKIPAALLSALPSPAAYAKVKFANAKQLADAKAKIATDWPTKVGA
jgi:putative spermidine/putrescine transport system substrate-binding protein